MTISEAIDLTLSEVRAQQSATSQLSYLSFGRALRDRWGSLPLVALSRREVQLWVNARRQQVSPVTVHNEVSFLRRCYRVAEEIAGLEIVVDPTRRLRMPKINNQRMRTLAGAEEEILKAAMSVWDFSLVEFAIQTGMRRLEQWNLRPDDIQLWQENMRTKGGRVVKVWKGFAHIRTSKTGRGRMCPLNPVAAQIAKRWLEQGKPYLFLGDYSGKRYNVGQWFAVRFVRLCQKLGIHDLRWHDLRHTAATRAIRNGARPEDVMLLLGHANLKQTMRYIHWAQDQMWPAAMAICGMKAA